MKLLTKELQARFKQVGSQEEIKDPIIIAKYFNPCGSATWYALEYNEQEKMFFGLCDLFGNGNSDCAELGYFSLEELERLQLPFGLGIERDLYFGEKKLSEVKKIKDYLI